MSPEGQKDISCAILGGSLAAGIGEGYVLTREVVRVVGRRAAGRVVSREAARRELEGVGRLGTVAGVGFAVQVTIEGCSTGELLDRIWP